jgi:hypothetical protein
MKSGSQPERRLLPVAERQGDGSRGLQPTERRAGGARRGATPETAGHLGGAGVATRRTDSLDRVPWAEAHGYRHRVAPRRPETGPASAAQRAGNAKERGHSCPPGHATRWGSGQRFGLRREAQRHAALPRLRAVPKRCRAALATAVQNLHAAGAALRLAPALSD